MENDYSDTIKSRCIIADALEDEKRLYWDSLSGVQKDDFAKRLIAGFPLSTVIELILRCKAEGNFKCIESYDARFQNALNALIAELEEPWRERFNELQPNIKNAYVRMVLNGSNVGPVAHGFTEDWYYVERAVDEGSDIVEPEEEEEATA